MNTLVMGTEQVVGATPTLRRAKADVRSRYVINFRVEPSVARSLLPVDWLEPQIVNGFAVMSFCPYVLDAVRLAGIPKMFGVASVCSAYRLAVIDISGPAARPAAWVPGRQTTARSVAKLGPRSLRTNFDRITATITVGSSTATTSILMTQHNGDTMFRATVEPAVDPSGVLFEDTNAFATFFTAATTSWAPSSVAGSWMKLDLDAGNTRYSPLAITSVDAPDVVGDAVVDSAFIGVGGSYCWSCAGIRNSRAETVYE